jgi:hypothetical protein
MRLGFFAYPWDLLDEGPENAIQAMVERGYCNAILLNSNYHHARLLRPRAQGPKTVQLPGAVAAFEPDAARYKAAGMMPIPDSRLVDSQVLARTRELCSATGVDFGLWSVGLHNSSLGEQQPELCMRNCFGDRYTYSLCPGNDRVRAYMGALFGDLAAQFRPDRILMEAIGYLGMRHWVHHELFFSPWNDTLELLLSLCFCPACVAAAGREGIDLATLRIHVAACADRLLETEDGIGTANVSDGELPSILQQIEDLQPALHWREETVTALVNQLHAIACEEEVLLEVIPASFHRPSSHAWLEGASLPALGGACDGLLIPAYFDTAEEVAADLSWAASRVPDHLLNVGLNACSPTLTESAELTAQVLVCHAAACSAVYHYNYGLLTERRLDWVAQANSAVLRMEGERA